MFSFPPSTPEPETSPRDGVDGVAPVCWFSRDSASNGVTLQLSDRDHCEEGDDGVQRLRGNVGRR